MTKAELDYILGTMLDSHKNVSDLNITADKPLQVEVTKNGKPDMAVEYLEYETGLPFDPTLFELPKGIKISEQK